MEFEKIVYKGWPDCIRLSNGEVELVVSTLLGPRILVYRRLKDGNNFLKNFDGEMADIRLEEWQSYGGHRLWHAPEVWPRTYYPDVEPVRYEWDGKALTLECATESTTGLAKTMLIELDERGTGVRLEHRIYNRNAWAVAFAPWCLTVMAPGGELIVPQEPFVPHGPGEGESFAMARSLVLWKFTRMDDPRFSWGGKFIRMRQDDRYESKLKFGVTDKQCWAAYALGRELFIKHFDYDPDVTYPDGGCNAEFFTMPGFLEIESLGALAPVEPGDYASLDESWNLCEIALGKSDDEIATQLAELV